MAETTTVQITRDTAAALDDVGSVMRRIFADLYTTTAPTKDTIVQFLIGAFMSGLTDDDIERLRHDWASRN